MGPGLDTRALDELSTVTWNPACRINSEPNLSTPSILWRHSWGASRRSVRLVHRIEWADRYVSWTTETGQRIFYLTIDKVRLYPAFYVDPRFDRNELEAITRCMGGLAGGSKWQFFTQPKGSLGAVTPLTALLAGRFAKVRASALAFFER